MKTWLWAVIALAAVFFGGWWLGRYVSRPEIVETTRIDTVFYERPGGGACAADAVRPGRHGGPGGRCGRQHTDNGDGAHAGVPRLDLLRPGGWAGRGDAGPPARLL